MSNAIRPIESMNQLTEHEKSCLIGLCYLNSQVVNGKFHHKSVNQDMLQTYERVPKYLKHRAIFEIADLYISQADIEGLLIKGLVIRVGGGWYWVNELGQAIFRQLCAKEYGE